MFVRAVSPRKTAAPSVGGVDFNTVTETRELHNLNEPASIEVTEDGSVISVSLVPQNTLFLMVLMFVGKIMCERVEPLKAFNTSSVTLVKLTNSLNVVIMVLPLNVVPMEFHRDDIQK